MWRGRVFDAITQKTAYTRGQCFLRIHLYSNYNSASVISTESKLDFCERPIWSHDIFYICILLFYSPEKHSFGIPSGLLSRLDSRTAPKYAHENWPVWPSVPSRYFPLHPVASHGISWSPVVPRGLWLSFSIISFRLQDFLLAPPFITVINQLCLESLTSIFPIPFYFYILWSCFLFAK